MTPTKPTSPEGCSRDLVERGRHVVGHAGRRQLSEGLGPGHRWFARRSEGRHGGTDVLGLGETHALGANFGDQAAYFWVGGAVVEGL